MNAHEVIDRFGNQTLRFKTVTVIIVAAAVIAVLAGVFYIGTRAGDGWAESRYSQERDENLKKIAKFEQNERQLAAENSLLKKQNEATAEILANADKKRAAEQAKAFADLATDRTKRYEEIDLDGDYDSQLCGLCADAERTGHKLSDTLCGRCKANP